MNRWTEMIIALSGLFLGDPVVIGAAAADEAARAAFLRDYKPPSAYLRSCKRGHEYTVEMVDHAPGVRRIDNLEGVANMTGFYIEESVLKIAKDDGTVREVELGRVEVGNPAYLAMLKKTAQGYALTSLDIFPSPRRMTASFFYSTVVESHVHDTYSSVVSNNMAQVVDYADQVIDGRPLKRLRLTLEARYPGAGTVPMTNDYYFDPEAQWYCVRIRMRSQEKIKEGVYEEQVFELAGRDKNWGGFPERIAVRDVDEERGRNTLTRTYQTRTLVEHSVEPEETRLTHFGLPEPQGVVFPKRGIPLYVWLLGGSLVLAALAVSAWRLARRFPTP